MEEQLWVTEWAEKTSFAPDHQGYSEIEYSIRIVGIFKLESPVTSWCPFSSWTMDDHPHRLSLCVPFDLNNRELDEQTYHAVISFAVHAVLVPECGGSSPLLVHDFRSQVVVWKTKSLFELFELSVKELANYCHRMMVRSANGRTISCTYPLTLGPDWLEFFVLWQTFHSIIRVTKGLV